ncbi:MAG: 3-dehydroquinate synthase [Pseudomonadota bacterium]
MTLPENTTRTVRVGLGARSYDIRIGPGLISALGLALSPLAKRPLVFIVTDETVCALHLSAVQDSIRQAGLEPKALTVPPGEPAKAFSHLEDILGWLLENGAERSDLLIALGGGVVGDLAGLAASLMKRGMTLVQVPTTLLAQVDSSVGGKTAINTRHGKNLVGTFYQPRLVLADTDTLATLPDRERAAGYAEVVKYGLIDDLEFFEWLEGAGGDVLSLKPEAIARAVEVSCAAKARIVAQDEREGGVRALLNLGHTFGHALEAENSYRPNLLHGEAIACGMVLALEYSTRLGLAPGNHSQRAADVLERAGLTTALPRLAGGPYPADRLVHHMRQDKKARAGRVPLILSRGIGKAFIQTDADLADVEAFLTGINASTVG